MRVGESIVGEIGTGALILVGVARGDTEWDVLHLARKVSKLRIFNDPEGRLNESIAAVAGDFLAVSQFTLYADCRKGNRPSYREAAEPDEGRRRYLEFVERLRAEGHRVETGQFQESMVVSLENDGPVTIIMESRGRTQE